MNCPKYCKLYKSMVFFGFYVIVINPQSDNIQNSIYGIVSAKRDLVHVIKFAIKMPYVYIVVTSERYTLSTSYFQHFLLHRFSM